MSTARVEYLDLGSSPGWWAATVATYCPSRMLEHPNQGTRPPVTLYSSHPYRVEDEVLEAAAEAAGDEDDVLESDGGVLRAVAEGAAGKRGYGRPGVFVDVVPLRSSANVPILQV